MKRTTLLVLVAAMATAMAAAGAASAHLGHGEDAEVGSAQKLDAKTNRELAEVRRATAKYHDADRALADGYVPAGPCAQAPGFGGMGYHYVNPALDSDAKLDPRKPEMLLYAPEENGKTKLVGVEWFVADADQDPSTDEDRPELLGVPFDGPMPGHGPGMPVHYDLHAWIFEHNPSGVFAPFNPRVSC